MTKPFGVRLTVLDRDYFFSVLSAEEQSAWIAAINKSVAVMVSPSAASAAASGGAGPA